MANPNYDYVIEAVRLLQDGQVTLARLYEKRGSTYSDHILMEREKLINQLKNNKLVAAGKRQRGLASTFDILGSIHLAGNRDNPSLILGEDVDADLDTLPGIPLI
jgi:hypothetical protein